MIALVLLVAGACVVASMIMVARYRRARRWARPAPPSLGQQQTAQTREQWWASHPHLQSLRVHRYNRGQEPRSFPEDF